MNNVCDFCTQNVVLQNNIDCFSLIKNSTVYENTNLFKLQYIKWHFYITCRIWTAEHISSCTVSSDEQILSCHCGNCSVCSLCSFRDICTQLQTPKHGPTLFLTHSNREKKQEISAIQSSWQHDQQVNPAKPNPSENLPLTSDSERPFMYPPLGIWSTSGSPFNPLAPTLCSNPVVPLVPILTTSKNQIRKKHCSPSNTEIVRCHYNSVCCGRVEPRWLGSLSCSTS